MTYTFANTTSNVIITGTCALTSAGQTFGIIIFDGVGETVTLQDAILVDAGFGLFAPRNGTIDTDSFNVTTGIFFSNYANVRTITLRNSTVMCAGIGPSIVWNYSNTTNLTFNPNTSTIILDNKASATKTFVGGGLTYNNLTITGDDVVITGSNTFNVLALNNGGEAEGTLIDDGTTQTVNDITTTASDGNIAILTSDSAGNAATISKASGIISLDFMSIKDITVTGGARWYAGANSVDVSGNTGWFFISPNSRQNDYLVLLH